VRFPEKTEALYFFADIDEKRRIWQQPPDVLRDALIATGDVLSPALEAIIENHLDQRHPIVIEGDGIMPSLLARPAIQRRAHDRRLRAVFLVESDEQALFSNMLARSRGPSWMDESELRTEAHAKWLFGQWLVDEANRYGLPVLVPRPWETLIDRIMTTCTGMARSTQTFPFVEQPR
jgi:2-phosphoglycerate kinase